MPPTEKYRDISLIGKGGFAEVWLCERETDGAKFARKRLVSVDDPRTVKRFIREVSILASLNHPNIVKVIASDLESPDNYWFIMPWYKQTLAQDVHLLARNWQRIPRLFGTLLDAMEYAHYKTAIHRDLKPTNILMNDDDDVVIADFGIGRFLKTEPAHTKITTTGSGLGSWYYIAPEQAWDATKADERSDVFSLGRVLYELFTNEQDEKYVNGHVLDPRIKLIIEMCTSREPEKRFSKVKRLKRAFSAALEPFESGLSDFVQSTWQHNPLSPDEVLALERRYRQFEETRAMQNAETKNNPKSSEEESSGSPS